MQGNATSFWGLGFSFGPNILRGARLHIMFDNNLSRSCTQSQFTGCLKTRVKGPYMLGVIVKCWGVRGCESEGIKGAYMNN